MEKREGEVRGEWEAHGQNRFDIYGADRFLAGCALADRFTLNRRSLLSASEIPTSRKGREKWGTQS